MISSFHHKLSGEIKVEQKLKWSAIHYQDEYEFLKTSDGKEAANQILSETIEEAPYRNGYLVRLTRIEWDENDKKIRHESLTFIPG